MDNFICRLINSNIIYKDVFIKLWQSYSDPAKNKPHPHDKHDDIPHEQAEDIVICDTIIHNLSDDTTEYEEH